MKDAIKDIDAERTRQIYEEKWTNTHDNTHRKGELAGAAACYALKSCHPSNDNVREAIRRAIADIWPFSQHWYKPTDRRQNLVKAGALIVAEIERIDRIIQKAD